MTKKFRYENLELNLRVHTERTYCYTTIKTLGGNIDRPLNFTY